MDLIDIVPDKILDIFINLDLAHKIPICFKNEICTITTEFKNNNVKLYYSDNMYPNNMYPNIKAKIITNIFNKRNYNFNKYIGKDIIVIKFTSSKYNNRFLDWVNDSAYQFIAIVIKNENNDYVTTDRNFNSTYILNLYRINKNGFSNDCYDNGIFFSNI